MSVVAVEYLNNKVDSETRHLRHDIKDLRETIYSDLTDIHTTLNDKVNKTSPIINGHELKIDNEAYTITFPQQTDTLVTEQYSQTLENKTLVTPLFRQGKFKVSTSTSDDTKRSLSFPTDSDDTVVTLKATQELTSKTLKNPTFKSSNDKTLSLPTPSTNNQILATETYVDTAVGTKANRSKGTLIDPKIFTHTESDENTSYEIKFPTKSGTVVLEGDLVNYISNTTTFTFNSTSGLTLQGVFNAINDRFTTLTETINNLSNQ